MRRFLLTSLLFTILAIVNITSAQENLRGVELTWGSEEILPSSYIMPEIAGHDESGFYLLSYDYRWAVEHYDTELRHTGKEYLTMHDKLRTREVEALIHFHDVLYLFTSEERFNNIVLYVETIDKKSLLQNNDIRIFKQIYNMSGWIADFGFRLSEKESKLLIYNKILAYWQKYQVLEWRVYGPGLEQIWEQRDEIDYTRFPRDEYEMLVDEKGNAFFINKYWDPRWFEIFKPQKNIYQILARTNNGENTNKYYADFQGKYIRGIGIESDNNNTLACSGFYSPAHVQDKIDGIFFFNIDLTSGKIQDRKFHEFDKFFITEAMGRRTAKMYDELIFFSLDYLVRRANGNYIMAAQQIYNQNYDTYNNIILVCLSPDGDILWDRTIKKSQNHNFDEKFNYASFCMLAPYDLNKVDIVYNEHLKNLNRTEDKKYKNFGYNGKAYLNHIEVGEFGETAESAIYLKTKKRMQTPLPVLYYDMKNTEMIVPSLRFRKLQFLKLSFQE